MSLRDDFRRALDTLTAAMAAAAAQWRLLLLWVVGLLIPTAIVAAPVRMLLQVLDWSPRSEALAHHFDILVAGDIVNGLVRQGQARPLTGAVMLSVIVAWLLAPLLSGATLTSARHLADAPPRLLPLVQGAAGWYVRLLGLQLVSLLSIGPAVGLGAVAIYYGDKRADHAVLASQAAAAVRGALFVTVVLFALAHAALEAARARLAADERPPSIWRAWAEGIALLITRPLTVLGLYLVPTLLAAALAALILLVRMRMVGAGMVTFAAAFLVTQLSMAALGWGRAARLLALTVLVRERVRGR